jgi:hypothetical protein
MTISGMVFSRSLFFIQTLLCMAMACTPAKEEDPGPELPASPVFETLPVNSITDNSAGSGATILSDAGFAITDKGLCFSIFPNPTISNARTKNGPGNLSFTSTMTNLTRNARYYVRSYVTNKNGTYYGNEITFNTRPGPVTAPLVSTRRPVEADSVSMVMGGEVLNDGGSPVTSRGVCYDTTSNPTLASPRTRDGSGVGPFSSTIGGLKRNKKYFVRAYAVNIKGTTFGGEYWFILP